MVKEQFYLLIPLDHLADPEVQSKEERYLLECAAGPTGAHQDMATLNDLAHYTHSGDFEFLDEGRYFNDVLVRNGFDIDEAFDQGLLSVEVASMFTYLIHELLNQISRDIAVGDILEYESMTNRDIVEAIVDKRCVENVSDEMVQHSYEQRAEFNPALCVESEGSQERYDEFTIVYGVLIEIIAKRGIRYLSHSYGRLVSIVEDSMRKHGSAEYDTAWEITGPQKDTIRLKIEVQ